MVLLDKFLIQGIIRPLDHQFGQFIYRLSSSDNAPYEAWLATIVSYELGQGHICFPLVTANGDFSPNVIPFSVPLDESDIAVSTLFNVSWKDVVNDSSVIASPGSKAPLIFDGHRLYLQRYWHYESVLARKLNQFNQPSILSEQHTQEIRERLNRLFPRPYSFLYSDIQSLKEKNDNSIRRSVCEYLDIIDDENIDWKRVTGIAHSMSSTDDLTVLDHLIPETCTLNWQKVAAAVAITHSFSVISGGPGTGKTTTVAKLLAILVEESELKASLPIIKLVAPTGKAAARLTESIGQAIENLPVSPFVRENIPTQAGTLHRLLGAFPGRACFRHHRNNPLHLDILIVDESSMVDLSLMYKLFDALPSHAKVILLGDKDQLASVEAGAILGDICSFQSYGYSTNQSHLIGKLTGYNEKKLKGGHHVPLISDGLCMLQKSYRFNSRSGIGRLSKAVNLGDIEMVNHVLKSDSADVHYQGLSAASYQKMISLLVEEYQVYLDIIYDISSSCTVESKAKDALNAFSRCRLLCAIKEGDFGVVGINERVENTLISKNKILKKDDSWYEGRPVMIIKNEHQLGVYNGDIGLCLKNKDGIFNVYFELADGSVKGILPSRLPKHETAYAMTIHKSQGSEFETTLLILPPEYTPMITRELIYTGMTRAKKHLYLFSAPNILNRGIKTLTNRISGLVDLLSSEQS